VFSPFRVFVVRGCLKSRVSETILKPFRALLMALGPIVQRSVALSIDLIPHV